MKQYYYTYKITCLKGSFKSCYYFGQHTTKKLNDGYCGSGLKLQRYYKKYGAIEGETYIKEIIAFYNNLEELNKAEFELIGYKYITDKNCLNLCSGGWKEGISDETRELQRQSHLGKKQSKETIEKRMKHIRGVSKSKEYKEKQRLVHLKAYENEEYHNKVRENTKIGMNKTEVKEKQRAAKLGKHWRINP